MNKSLGVLKFDPPIFFLFLRHISNKNGKNVHSIVPKSSKKGAVAPAKSLTILDEEAAQIQASFQRTKLDPRDQFGSLSKTRMPQTEAVQKGFQPDIWDQGYEIIRVVKEREKTFRERLNDEFAEGRAKQVSEPLKVTIKHALRKAEKMEIWRARKEDAIKNGLPIPLPPKIEDGIVTAKLRKARKALENGPQLELVRRGKGRSDERRPEK